jgi:Family of unknown function (DUF6920)
MILECFADRSMPKTNEFKGLSVATSAACAPAPRTQVEVSARSAHGPARVKLVFDNGEITRMEADDRPRAIGRRIVATRWQELCRGYREIAGCRIPTEAAVSWFLDDGPFEYWRGKITASGMK